MGMLIIILVVIIATYIIGYIKTNSAGDAFTAAIVAFGITAMVSLVFSQVMPTAAADPSEYKVTNISALSDSTRINGTFFLGTGTVDEKDYYFYMVDGEYGKQMKKMEIGKRVYLNDAGAGQPRLEVVPIIQTTPLGRFLFSSIPNGHEYIFYVPEGSVTTEFNVNME